jgi:hypothetical protein
VVSLTRHPSQQKQLKKVRGAHISAALFFSSLFFLFSSLFSLLSSLFFSSLFILFSSPAGDLLTIALDGASERIQNVDNVRRIIFGRRERPEPEAGSRDYMTSIAKKTNFGHIVRARSTRST